MRTSTLSLLKKLNINLDCMYLITGAGGFIGRSLAKSTREDVPSLVLCARDLVKIVDFRDDHKLIAIESIGSSTNWMPALEGVKVVVHCAARAHVMREQAVDALAAYREVNVQGTLRLAEQAVAAGVRRFVFLSSIGVNGNQNATPFTEADAPKPHNAYAVSKLEAENALLALATQTGMEVVIIRPPLVYGPNAPGDFGNLVRWVQRGLPLPLGAVHNQRSLVAIDNLVNLVLLCADRERSPQAANQVFVVADGQDVSTTTLLRKVAQAAGCPSRLVPVPARLMHAGATLLGKRAVADRLLGNLQVDASKARTLLGWRPVVTMEQQLAAMFTCTLATAHCMPLATRAVLRLLDVLLAGVGLLGLWPLLLVLYALGLFDTGAPLLRQERVGRHQRPFVLVKFRTMRRDTAHVASHLASSSSITPLGAVLRRTKLDELPQLWNVLLGHMSLVGPRPGLFNQHDLTQSRTAHGVYAARPGITGLAQVNGIDMSTPDLLAQTDARMLCELSVSNYFKFIFQTVLGKGAGDGVKTK